MLEVMAGRPGYVDAAARPPDRLRIAVSRKVPRGLILSIAADQKRVWEQVGDLLRELGHEVTETVPAYGNVGLEFTQHYIRGIYEDTLTVPEPDKLERSTQGMARAGRRFVSERRAQRIRTKRAATTARILALWDDVDVLMTPALARGPIAAEGGYGKSAFGAFNVAGRFTPWTAVFNMTGQPAVTIPAGTGDDGLPLGVQLVGRPGAEDLLYSLAGQIEAARPWADRRPPIS
jgi:amidase